LIVGIASMRRFLKEAAMSHVTYIVAIATLAGAVAGCADQYYPGSGYPQNNYSPSGYNYPTTSSYPAGPGYYPNRYGYGDYNRNYSGTRSPQITFTLPN
jgi:hypothetical protein